MKLRIKLLGLFLLMNTSLIAQFEPDTSWDANISGYVKSMQNYYSSDQPDINSYFGLIHHRLNFTLDAPKNFKFHLGARNRLYIDPGTSGLLAEQFIMGYQGAIDLDKTLVNKNGLLWHINIDRLYAAYEGTKWEVRLGRQRINWGISTFWNPNDLFNAYNFTDFDYEERPGTDAVLVQYAPGYNSSYTIAYQIDTSWEASSLASRIKYNVANYDLQMILGKYRTDLAIGGGWAGSIGGAGFKGEFMNFIPSEEEREYVLSFAMMTDYVWSNGMYTMISVFFNSAAAENASLTTLYASELSAKNLYPYRYSTGLTLSYPLSPIISTGVSTVFSFDKSAPLFLSPTFTYNIAENWDMDILGQWFFMSENKSYETALTGVFLRFKWSY